MKPFVLISLVFYSSLSLLPFLTFAAQQSTDKINCDEAYTTQQMNHCAHEALQAEEVILQTYVEQSLIRFKDDKPTQTAIKNSQEAWENYKTAHCNAVFSAWRDGTIRTLMKLGCYSQLTQQRTLQLWSDYLVAMDGTALYPKPTLTH